MSKGWLLGISAAGMIAVAGVPQGARAAADVDVSTKNLIIKENVAKPEKRQMQVQSKDALVLLAGGGNPTLHGASVHFYSATDDQCVYFPAGSAWTSKPTKWMYKSKTDKNQIQLADGKLQVKIKHDVTYDLADDAGQGVVNVKVQIGEGTIYCMRCGGATKDDAKIFNAKNCVIAACDAEPSVCSTTVTTTTSTSTTTTTLHVPTVLMGALNSTNGVFNYNLIIGLAGADAACNSNFLPAHACTYAELQAAETAGDLVGLKSTPGNQTVTSFWAIDPLQPANTQCDDGGGAGLRWHYATAHTGVGGRKVPLTNATGVLGSVSSGLNCGSANWVGCCSNP